MIEELILMLAFVKQLQNYQCKISKITKKGDWLFFSITSALYWGNKKALIQRFKLLKSVLITSLQFAILEVGLPES